MELLLHLQAHNLTHPRHPCNFLLVNDLPIVLVSYDSLAAVPFPDIFDDRSMPHFLFFFVKFYHLIFKSYHLIVRSYVQVVLHSNPRHRPPRHKLGAVPAAHCLHVAN
jgi:hypothetical protein